MNKHDFRKHARSKRANIVGRTEKSRAIWERLRGAFTWPPQGWVCSYIGMEPEVVTQCYLHEFVPSPLTADSHPANTGSLVKLAVPFCLPQHLNLFHLQDWSELTESNWGLKEPSAELRRADRLVEPGQISLFVVPGLAFDRRGNRLGYGKGYYDKLLGQRRPGSLAVALAFQDQVFEQVPHDPAFDVAMDYVVTEEEVIDCRSVL
jgi:5-formyltetrahydrofolate cyclo-ligase